MALVTGPLPSTVGSVLAAETTPSGGQVFTLREVSVFEGGGQDFIRGQMGETQEKPYSQVKQYPKFASEKPIYGVIRFEIDYRRANSGIPYYFAIDESRGTGKGYDRLYFDINHDLDLQNDAVVRPLRNPPSEASLHYSGIKEQVVFNYLAVPFDEGDAGKRSVEIMPRLLRTVYEQETYNQVSFVRTHLYSGSIKIGPREYGARLGNKYLVNGRLDLPTTSLVLTPRSGRGSPSWWGGDSLSATHKVDGVFYTFSANPTGDKLTVRRYKGELGTFEVGPGTRSLDKLSFRGSLQGTNMAAPVGGEVVDGWPENAHSCLLPVGDYLPSYLNVEFGRLKIFLSDNYHSDGKPRDRGGRAPVHGIHIRKDKPFVLDFTTKPEVLFASPAKDVRLKPGDTLEVKAVLIDPKLDIMIRGLDDSTRKQKGTAEGPSGRPLSLDPTVIVRRENGEKVAEGVMPFG